jgi:hypothetical protein
MKRFLLFVLLFAGISYWADAQLIFNFLPEVHGRSVDGLGTFQVQNPGAFLQTGKIIISIQENGSRLKVLDIISPQTTFNPGTTRFSKSLFNLSAFNFAANSYGEIANQTRTLPSGEYTFCFKFVPADKTLFDESENCFDATIEPLVPLTLLNPGDRDTICIKRPVLSWQPPMPFSSSMRFRLFLTEKKEGEAIENMLMNRPLLFLNNISASTVNYPSVNPELKEGKTYFWQVIAYEKGLIISKSEIWEFTVKCKEDVLPAPNDSYRELKLLQNGNYYIANRFLKFSFLNNYNVKKLQYSIHDIANAGEKIKNMPEVNLQQGFNRIDIDISDMGLKQGKQYLLRVYPFNEPSVEVRFMYKEDDNIEIQ